VQEIVLNGVRVRLGQPRVIAQGVGHCYFPGIIRCGTGELIVSYLLAADATENQTDSGAVSISRDGGETWLAHYEVAGFGGGAEPRLVLPDGAVAKPRAYYQADPAGQQRRFVGAYERFEAGGERYVLEPRGSCLEGFPRDVRVAELKWNRRTCALMQFYGQALLIDGAYLAPAYLTYDGDSRYTAVVMRSTDLGRTWRYYATLGGPDSVPGAPEGPDECGLIQLADGDLMAVLRVGTRAEWPLARTYSHDGGRTWSKMDRLPAYSVAPCLRRLQNGAIVLGTGRPGVYLWLSLDPRGERWQAVDLLAHHNAALGPEHHIRAGQGYSGAGKYDPSLGDQSTAYIDMLEVAPNRLLLVYDRTPFGWDPTPADSGERNVIYVLPVEVDKES
jgi:hypothetical protein